MARPPHRRPIRITIADDHTLLREGLRKLLEEQPDMEVVAETSSGDGIIQILRHSEANVLLLDLEMPEVDGYDVLRNLQVAAYYIATLVFTDEEGQVDFNSVLDLGASGIISKRAATSNLLIAIREVYQGVRWIDRELREPDMPDFGRGRNGGQSDGLPRTELTPRETEIASLVSKGLRYREIAGELTMSPHTLNNHLRHIFDKLHLRGRVDLAIYGLKHKM